MEIGECPVCGRFCESAWHVCRSGDGHIGTFDEKGFCSYCDHNEAGRSKPRPKGARKREKAARLKAEAKQAESMRRWMAARRRGTHV